VRVRHPSRASRAPLGLHAPRPVRDVAADKIPGAIPAGCSRVTRPRRRRGRRGRSPGAGSRSPAPPAWRIGCQPFTHSLPSLRLAGRAFRRAAEPPSRAGRSGRRCPATTPSRASSARGAMSSCRLRR
jgi:hypothetical protein